MAFYLSFSSVEQFNVKASILFEYFFSIVSVGQQGITIYRLSLITSKTLVLTLIIFENQKV